MTDGEPPDDAPVRILVVDDDEGVRDTVCDVLTELGYAADPASDGTDALDRFRPGRYRLVVTDLTMPRMNGLQLAAFGITLTRKPDVEGLTRLIVRTLQRRDIDDLQVQKP
jgi:CheY-like chemotaxis protein